MAYEGNVYTKRQPDLAYTMQLIEQNKRLRSQIDKNNGVLIDTETAYKRMIELLKANEELTQEQLDLMRLQRPTGKLANITITLPIGSTARLVHLDFIGGSKMSVLPPNSNIAFPFSKLYTLTVTNDGPGTIVYSPNESRNSNSASAVLYANESDDLGRYPYPTFETLNLALETGSAQPATVRIRGLA